MQEHCARRCLAQQSLEQFALLMQTDASQLPHNLHNIVAALSYGKCEVLWYFQNVNEVCRSSLRALLGLNWAVRRLHCISHYSRGEPTASVYT